MKNVQWTTSKKNSPLSAKRNSKPAARFLLLAFLFGSFLAQSQDLTAFKYASEQSSGRKIIPYPELQGAAKTMHDQQLSATSAAAGYNSAKLLSDKNLYVGFRGDVERNLAASKSALASDKGTDASKTATLKKKVATDEADLKEILAKIKDLDANMTAGIPKWEAVEDARIRVREVFREAYDEVDDSEDHPDRHIGKEPSSSDKAAHDQWAKALDSFKRYTYKIKSLIQAGYPNHDDEIKVAHDAVLKMQEGLRLH